MSKRDKKVQVREIVYSEDDEKSFGDIFVYEPENIEEQNLGNLFIVGELKDLPRNCSYIINLLASKIKKEFYSDTKRGAEESLEAGLGEANKTLSEIADQGNGEYLGKLSMVCGTYRGNKFYMSQVGRIKSLLIRGDQLLEIVREDTSRAVSPKRVFTDIASGELVDGDLVLFATMGLFNVFSLEELRQLGATSDLDDFSGRLQEEIEEGEGEIVSALLMKIGGHQESKMNRVEIGAEAESEEALSAAEVIGEEVLPVPVLAEEELLSPALSLSEAIEEKKREELALSRAQAVTENPQPERAEEDEESRAIDPNAAYGPREEAAVEIPVAAADTREVEAPASPLPEAEKMSLSDVIKQYEKMESKSPEVSGEKDKHLEEIISRKDANNFEDLDEQGLSLHQKISSHAKGWMERVRLTNFKENLADRARQLVSSKKEYRVQGAGQNLSLMPGKKLLLLGVVILIVSAGAFAWSSSRNRAKDSEKLATYQALLSDAQSKLEQAEVASVGGSNAEAGKLYLEAKTLASRIKDEYDGLDAEADQLIASTQTEIDRIDLVERVGDPQTLVTFDNSNLQQLVSLGGTYYAIDGKENAVYELDSKGSQLKRVAAAADKIGEITLAQGFSNQEILLSDGSQFLSFNAKTAAVTKVTAKLDAGFSDFTTYGKNVYLLSAPDNQIYKYQKSGAAFGAKTEWLKSGDIKDAISLAIDQNIFLLTSAGEVKKYFTGSEAVAADGSKFALQQPSDALARPARIYTESEQKYLYVTEPSKQRIVLFDKTTGALVKQYVSPEFADLRDLSVDTEETALVALLPGKIVKIDLAL